MSLMGFYEDLIAVLNLSLDRDFDGKPYRMGQACGVHPTTLKRLLDGERSKWAQMLGRVADAAGVKITGSPSAGCSTPEAARVDEVIMSMRKMGMAPDAIRAGAVKELDALLEKKSNTEQPKQTKLAG